LCDEVLRSGADNVQEVRKLTGGAGVERAVDCSANDAARATAIRATRKWGVTSRHRFWELAGTAHPPDQ